MRSTANRNVQTDDSAVELVELVSPDGRAVWTVPGDPRRGLAAQPRRPVAPERTAVLPRDVMASGTSWEEIRRMVADQEHGQAGDEPVVRPGGQIAKRESGEATGPTSVLPRDVMAAGPTIAPPPMTAADVDELAALDPNNAEQWRPVYGGPVPGWTFTMAADLPGVPDFRFFAYRSSPDGGRWRIAVLAPNMDARHGHKAHILHVPLGGESRPVLCGPGGRACVDLAEVRGFAAKWKLYTSFVLAGRSPGFSL